MKKHVFKNTDTLDGLLDDWFGRDKSMVTATDEGRLHWERTLEEGSALSSFFLKDSTNVEDKFKELYKIGNEYLSILGVNKKLTFLKTFGGTTDGKTVAVGTSMFDDKNLTFQQALDIFIGLTIHEGLHNLHSKFDFYPYNSFTHFVCNCLEDERIEILGGKSHPGFMGFISRTKYYSFKPTTSGNLTLMQRFLNSLCGCIRFPLALNREEVALFGYYLLKCKEIINNSPLASTDDCWKVSEEIFNIAKELYEDEKKDRESKKDDSESKDTFKPEDESTPESEKDSSEDKDSSKDTESSEKPQGGDEMQESDGSSEGTEGKPTEGNTENENDDTESDSDASSEKSEETTEEGETAEDSETSENGDGERGEDDPSESEDSTEPCENGDGEAGGSSEPVTTEDESLDMSEDMRNLKEIEEYIDRSKDMSEVMSELAEGRTERGTQPNCFIEKASNGKDSEVQKRACKNAYEGAYKSISRYVPTIRRTLASLIEEHEVKFYGMRNGKLDPSKLVEARQGVPNVYTQQHKHETQGATIVLLVDESGSMDRRGRDVKARNAVILINESLKGLKGIDLYIYGHTADSWKRHIKERYEGETNIITYKEGSRDTGHDEDLARISAKSENRDGVAILEVAQRVRKHTSNKALYVILSDGAPAAWGYSGEKGITDTKEKISKVQKMDFDVVGVTIDGYESKNLYPEELRIDDLNELPLKLARYIKKYLQKRL